MSYKLKGLLMDSFQSKVERSYLQEHAMVVENVPCEMTFEATSAFIEHESEQHQFLPVFHLTGYVTELHGDFPCNVSSIYFGEMDKQYLEKDCLYYPSPKELSHMIETGGFFTKRFQIPEILHRNTYSFPAMVNLTVVPPEQVVAGMSEEDANKTAIPLMYVSLQGSGVSKKNDKLLDYYGVEFDEDFPMYALTAESSGYTDPPLMEYITEMKPVEEQKTADLGDDYYITEEEEVNLVRAKEQEQATTSFVPDYQHVDAEDMLLASADRKIARRMEEKIEQKKSKLLAKTETMEQTVELTEESTMEKTDTKELVSESASMEHMDESEFISNPEDDVVEQPVEEQVESEVFEEAVEDTVAQEVVESEDVLTEPDNPEEAKHVTVAVNESQVGDALLREQIDVAEKSVSEDEELLEKDDATLEDLSGKDVVSADAQVKLNEQRMKQMVRDSAQDIREDEDAVKEEQTESEDKKTVPEKVKSVGREVTSAMQDISDAYEEQLAELEEESVFE